MIAHFVAGTTTRTAARLCGLNRKTETFYFHRLREIIALELVVLAVHEFWSGRSSVRPVSTARTLSFEALAHEPGSPGRVFVLDENALADMLLKIEEANRGSAGYRRWASAISSAS